MAATEDELFSSLKGFVDVFLHYCKSIAATFEKSPSHTSKPVTVDESKVSNLKLKLEAIRVTLKKADALSLSDEVNRLWMRELRDLEYWAEDVLEQIQFEYFRGKRFQEIKEELLEKASVGKRKREISMLFPAVYSGPLLVKIKRITDRFQEIYKDRKALSIREQDGARLAQPVPLTPTSSFPTCHLQGRARDMAKLIDLLSTDDASNGSLYSTIPIVGMAGVGKTHLVQHAYQNTDSFELKIWVSVSQQCDVVEITRRIVESIERESPNLSQLDPLQSKLSGLLKDQKFLLVLDDMCDEDPEHWERLRVPLNCGAKGSRVVVTTKSMKVSQMMCLKRFYLDCLSEDDSWGICSERVNKHYGNESNLDFNMIDIGKKLAARCKGLPLAAQAVGAALSSELNEKHWSTVLENYLLIEDQMVIPALRVSYDYLPLHLKYCFAYCSLFPKGYIFEKNKLVHLWMAQGFIHPDHRNRSSPEEIGCRYFDNLVERCFFQYAPSHYSSEGKYVMHDLYHELAEKVSGKQYNRTEDYKIQKLDDLVRHSSMVPQESNSKEAIKLGSFGRQDLRTVLFVVENKDDKPEGVHFSMNIPRDLFPLLECVRVLDLSNTDIKNLPSTIGCLIHLRYLSFESTKITILPESIVGLFNLQTLNLKHCCDLEELPMGMKLMDKLRHLYLPLGANCSLSMPAGMGQMTSLQTLPLIAVKTETGGCGVEELGSLENLKGELHISEMNNVTDVNFAEQANMQKKNKLQKLTLEWSTSPGFLEEPAPEVLEKLKPHSNLEELIIKGFCGNRFPSWLGDEYLLKLDSLEIKNCKNVQELPSLGRLPSLKYLFIQSLSKLRSVGPEFCGHASSSSSNPCIVGFPKLETLVFKKMDALEEWVGVEKGDFPRMKSLTFNRCEKLHTVPEFPTSDNVKERNPVIKRLPSKKAHDCPLLILSDCGSKFEEEMQIPNNQVQAINNTKSTDSDDVEMIESGSISGKTVIQVQEMQASNIQVQTSNTTRCSDSNDVNMVESGSKIQEAIQVKEIQTPNSQVQVRSNYTPCLCSDDVIKESGSNTLDKTVACFQDIQTFIGEVQMNSNPCSYSDDIAMAEANPVKS